MKKKLLFIVVTFFCGCQSNAVSKNSKADSANADSFKNLALPKAKKESSTLDSLQGIWISVTDRNDKVMFRGNKHYAIYESDTAISTVYLSASCLLNDTVVGASGNTHIILVDDENKDSQLCYQLDYLTKGKLSIVYSGRYLTYDKE